MADPVLKFPPEQKGDPPAKPRTKIAAEPRRRLMAGMRRYRRVLLLVVLPLVALVAGVTFYLNGGRYVTTDDAYVGAQKVLITPDVAGKIISVAVKEGQQVTTGDVLFQIDPVPFRLALAQARAKLDDARTSHDNLVANVKLYAQTIELVNAGIALKQKDVERKHSLVKSNAGSQLDLDNSATALVTAQAQRQIVTQQRSNALNQLLGDPELPLEQFPAYMQAKAALDDAQRNLDLTTVRAPMNGIATQVEQIQLGRFVIAGTPVFSVIDTVEPVGRRQSEGNRLHLCRGRPVRHARGRRLPQPRLQGHGRLALARHRRAVRDPAAAERHRQLRQGGAARAGADLFRQQRQVRPQAEGRHERLRHHRHRASPLARRAVRLRAGGGVEGGLSRSCRPPPQPPLPFPACAGPW